MRAVILDFDGVIVDSEPVHLRSFEILLARHGIRHRFTDDEFGRAFVGISVAENAEYMIQRFHLRVPAAQIVAERERIYRGLIEEPANLIPMPGLVTLLDALEADSIAVAIASGSTRDQVESVLRSLGLAARFPLLVTAGDVARNKPAPDVYLRALQLLGLPAVDCLAVEDSEPGIAAAQAAGLRAVALPNRFTRRQDLTRANGQVENLIQLLQWIESH